MKPADGQKPRRPSVSCEQCKNRAGVNAHFFDTVSSYDIIQADATLAQSAEQLIRNEQVIGSIPMGGSQACLFFKTK